MLNLNLNWISETIKSLAQWWPVVKSNFQQIQNNINSHFLGATDKHKAEDVTYSGKVIGATNSKEGLDLLNDQIEIVDNKITTIVTTPIDGEAAAQELVLARGQEPSLPHRLDKFSSQLATMVNHKPILIFEGMPTVDQLPVGVIGAVIGIDEFYDNFNGGILNTNKWKITKGFVSGGGIDALSDINVQNDKMSLSVRTTVSAKSAEVRAMVLGGKLYWENQKKIISFKTTPYASSSSVSLYIENNEATNTGVISYIIRLVINNNAITLQVNGVGSTIVYNQSYAVTASDNIEKTYSLELLGKNIRLLENGIEKLNTNTLPSLKTNYGYVYITSDTTSMASLVTRTIDEFSIS